jgi:hypothetical protein
MATSVRRQNKFNPEKALEEIFGVFVSDFFCEKCIPKLLCRTNEAMLRP